MAESVTPPDRRPRVALAHDWLVGLRGGERVLDAIVRALVTDYEIVGIFTMFRGDGPLTPAIDGLPVTVAPLGRLPGATRLRRWMLPLYPRAVASLSQSLACEHARQPIDLVISTSSAAIKGLRPPSGVSHVCYLHSPARYVWSQRDEYSRTNLLRGAGLRLLGERFKRWDRETAANVTRFIANSTHTAAECRRYYGRDADVIFPPVRTQLFTPPAVGGRRESFWLVVSALEPYKRVEAAIAAAKLARVPLVVAGDGSQAQRLRRLAPDAGFVGRVSDAELLDLYRRARGLLFPQVEDFGIVAAEALASGLPVVARRAGGARDVVTDGVTGVLYDGDRPEDLAAAMARCPVNGGWACRAGSLRFTEARFAGAIKTFVRSVLA